MGLFDKVVKTGKSVATSAGNAVASTAVSVGSSAVTATKEQSELAGLKSEINVIEKELDASYVMIGRKFIDYVLETKEMPGIDVSDILSMLEPKLERKSELQAKIIELEKRIKEKDAIRDKQVAESEYLTGKEKLDKALAMSVIDQAEYDEKVAVLKKKYDNFSQIRRLEQQRDMGIITEEEMNAKLFDLLN